MVLNPAKRAICPVGNTSRTLAADGLHDSQTAVRALGGAGCERGAAGGTGYLCGVVIDDCGLGGPLLITCVCVPVVAESLECTLGVVACDRKPVPGASGVAGGGWADDVGVDPRADDHGAEFFHLPQAPLGEDGGLLSVAHEVSLSERLPGYPGKPG